MEKKKSACLIRKKGDQKQICVAMYGDERNGVSLYWEDFSDNWNRLFDSVKQAWWAWYQWKKRKPEETEGWFVEVIEI